MKSTFTKTTVSILIMLAMVFGTFSMVAYADTKWGVGTYKVTTGISMRSTPEVPAVNSTSNKIGSVPKGTTVVIENIEGSWGFTEYKGLSGWVCMDYLQFVNFDMYIPEPEYYVNCDSLNIRSQVSTSSKIKGVVNYGASVTINKTRSDGWVNVTIDGITGWVMKKYLIQRYEQPIEETINYSNCTVVKNANLRTGPGTEFNVRMVIPAGESIVISKIIDGFAMTAFDNTLGWVSLDLLEYAGTSSKEKFGAFTRSIMPTAGDGAVYAEGIDISRWNGDSIDWFALKQSGVDFVIIRIGTTNGIDKEFEENYEAAKAVGLDVGTYFYTYSTSVKGAQKDAELCLKWLEGKQMEYPVYFDIEDPAQNNLKKTTCTNMCTTFCDALIKAGWCPGVFTMASWWSSKLDYNSLGTKYESWVSRVRSGTDGSVCSPSGLHDYASEFGMYQWNWNGQFKAISNGSAGVDLDVAYKDYPTMMKNSNLNGYKGAPSRNTFVKKLYGDIDNSEKIDMSDVVYMQKAVAQLVELTGAEMVLADVNCDQDVTMDDVVSVQQYIANLKKTFAVG